MKARHFASSIIAAVLVFFTAPARAAEAATAIMSSQAAPGVGSATVTSAAVPVENPKDTWAFTFTCRGANGAPATRCGVELEVTLDPDLVLWAPLHRFTAGSDEVFAFPTCGACIFRAVADEVGPDHAASVAVAVSGATVAVTTPIQDSAAAAVSRRTGRSGRSYSPR